MNSLNNRIDLKFSDLRSKGERAVIIYLCAGDPDLNATARFVRELERSGADMVELGVPFSDPIADGPEIQAAAHRALASGSNLHRVLELVGDLRSCTNIPLLLMGYYNPFLRYGLDAFAARAAETGVDGIIVPDLSLEESGPLKEALHRRGLELVPLIAPTTPLHRIKRLAEGKHGFVYCVSRTGVTGARDQPAEGVGGYLQTVRSLTDRPIAVGFGISTPAQAVEMAPHVDGVIIGSAVVRIIASCGPEVEQACIEIGRFVKQIKQALDATA